MEEGELMRRRTLTIKWWERVGARRGGCWGCADSLCGLYH